MSVVIKINNKRAGKNCKNFCLTPNSHLVFVIKTIIKCLNFTDNVKHIDVVLGNKAELPCDVHNVKNSSDWPVLMVWYKGQDFPIYR